MATLVLGGIGSAIGGSLTSTILGATAGKFIGSTIGKSIDGSIFGSSRRYTSDKPLRDIYIQGTEHGSVIPIVLGTVKIAGNIIWTSKLKKHITTHNTRTGSKIRRIKQSHTSYIYTISLAIGICNGPISSVAQIWANDILLHDQHNIRIYLGDEDQQPDPIIEAIHGSRNAPAYRGLAYVVIQDLNITEFGNRIPNFTFEVCKYGSNAVERLIESIIIIPGSGEFVYDTRVQATSNSRGLVALNQHHTPNKANAVVALDQMRTVLPNIKWIAPTVAWFATDFDAGKCEILPGIESHLIVTSPDDWKVSDYIRETAHLISTHDKMLNYGGTTNDASVVRYLHELKERRYSIMFYPMLMVDLQGKPWRGKISGTPYDIKQFFNGKHGYNRFILHYANLVSGLVDAFIIGSEMVSLTSVRADDGSFPAVDELISLASEVKKILGPNTKVSYAANWSEYHHTEGGWYNMDKLWASANIDFVGIDAYFPLTNVAQSEYDIASVMDGWKQNDEPAPESCIKNIVWWWRNHHVNPDGQQTQWQPMMKKIWFTEYGFPSISCATNQPNIFPDDTSIESGFPKYSDGTTDILAQRVAIQATEMYWKNSNMVERIFLWTWDARPYPTWPHRTDVWSDAKNWAKGHWVNGKFGLVELKDVVRVICLRAGLSGTDIDVSELHGIVHGIVLSQSGTVRNVMEMLQQVYLFDVVEDGDKLKFISHHNNIKCEKISYDEIIQIDHFLDKIDTGNINAPFSIDIERAVDIPSNFSINCISKTKDYDLITYDLHMDAESLSKKSVEIDLPIVMGEKDAHNIIITMLSEAWATRLKYDFHLPLQCSTKLLPGNVISIETDGIEHKIKITAINIKSNMLLHVSGQSLHQHLQPMHSGLNFISHIQNNHSVVEHIILSTNVEILDIPALSHEDQNSGRIIIAATGSSKKWFGCTIRYKSEHSSQWSLPITIITRAAIGMATQITELTDHIDTIAKNLIIDTQTQFIVRLNHGKLYSISSEKLFDVNHQNVAIIGDEIIKFANAELQEDGSYIISNLLRGLYGTAVTKQQNMRFVPLDLNNLTTVHIPKELNNLKIYYEIQTMLDHAGINTTTDIDDKKVQSFKYQSNNLKPLAPINLIFVRENATYRLQWTSRTLSNDLFVIEDKQLFFIRIIDEMQNLLYEDVTRVTYHSIPTAISDKWRKLGIDEITVYIIAQCDENISNETKSTCYLFQITQ